MYVFTAVIPYQELDMIVVVASLLILAPEHTFNTPVFFADIAVILVHICY